MFAVILAGGVGERFWPASRAARPKQLLDLTGQGSMIRLTVERLAGLSKPDEILVITSAAQEAAIAHELSGLVTPGNIIGEPVGKNTAPSVGVAAVLLERRAGDAPFFVCAADALVGDIGRFRAALEAGEDFVRNRDMLLAIGIAPARPETGYGYIQAAEPLFEKDGVRIFRAAAFHEKPDAETAKQYLAAGTYSWNACMFMWRTRTILQAFREVAPDVSAVLDEIGRRLGREEIAQVLADAYQKFPSIAVDYAVMERARNVAVLRGDFSWNDVGSWETIRDLHSADPEGNVLVGDHVCIGSANNTVFSPGRTVALLGADDLIVVTAGDAVLVARRSRAQEVKRIVEELRKKGRMDLL